MSKPLSKEIIQARSNELFGIEEYVFLEKLDAINGVFKCKTHKIKFIQNIKSSHLKGYLGCKKCSKEKRERLNDEKRKIKTIEVFKNEILYLRRDKKIENKGYFECVKHGKSKTSYYFSNTLTGDRIIPCKHCQKEQRVSPPNTLTEEVISLRLKDKFNNLSFIRFNKKNRFKGFFRCKYHGELSRSYRITTVLNKSIKNCCVECSKDTFVVHNKLFKKEINEKLNDFLNKKAPYKITFVRRDRISTKETKGFFHCQKHGDIIKSKHIANCLVASAHNPCDECNKEERSKRVSRSTAEIQKLSDELFGYYTFFKRDIDTSYGLFKCSRHPEKGMQRQSISSHLKGHAIQCCSNTGLLDINDLQKKSNETFGSYRFIIKNVLEGSKAVILCSKHKNEFTYDKTNHTYAKYGGCKKCNSENKNGRKKPLFTFLEIKKEGEEKYPDHVFNEGINQVFVQNRRTKFIVTCKEHGDFQATYNKLFDKEIECCPECNPKMSINEKRINDYLMSLNIEFEYNKSLKSLRRINSLRVDFYLPKYRLIIEYDGEQHFRHVKKFGSFEKFKILQECDEIKNNYAHENNLNLLRIPYNKRSQIKRLIDSVLNKIGQGEKIFLLD